MFRIMNYRIIHQNVNLRKWKVRRVNISSSLIRRNSDIKQGKDSLKHFPLSLYFICVEF